MKLEKVINVGDKVSIKAPESWADGEWGIVKAIDGDTYYVAIANDTDTQLVFDKSELRKTK